MSELSMELYGQRFTPNLHSANYSNTHAVRYNGNYELQADAALAAVSNCHRMAFLALAAKANSQAKKHSRQR